MIKPLIILRAWILNHPHFKWLSFIPALFWAGIIFWLSDQSFLPRLETPWTEFLWKKTAHFLIFGGLFFWLWWGQKFSHKKFLNSTSSNLLLLSLVLIYAICDEIHQSFVTNRHPSSLDVGIDLLGASCLSLGLWQRSIWPKWFDKLSSSFIPE